MLEKPVPFVVPSLGKRPPAGKSVVVITCTLPICGNNIPVGTAKLHWKFHEVQYNTNNGPQAYAAAFNQALQAKPNYIIDVGIYPPAVVSPEMAQAQAEHIPVIQVTGLSNNSAIKSCINCSAYLGQVGKVIGDLAIAGKATGANTLSLGIVGNVGTLQTNAGLVAEFHRLHAGTPQFLNVSFSTTVAQNIASVLSYVQAHPNVTAIVNTFPDITVGLPSALRQAGLSSKVKYYTSGAETPDINLLEHGQEAPTVAFQGHSAGFTALYEATLLSVHKRAQLNPTGWIAIMDKSNASLMLRLAGTPDQANPPHWQEAFYKAWGV